MCWSSVFHWSFDKTEDEEWNDEQHGAEGVTDCCAVVPVYYRGEYPKYDVINTKSTHQLYCCSAQTNILNYSVNIQVFDYDFEDSNS